MLRSSIENHHFYPHLNSSLDFRKTYRAYVKC